MEKNNLTTKKHHHKINNGENENLHMFILAGVLLRVFTIFRI